MKIMSVTVCETWHEQQRFWFLLKSNWYFEYNKLLTVQLVTYVNKENTKDSNNDEDNWITNSKTDWK